MSITEVLNIRLDEQGMRQAIKEAIADIFDDLAAEDEVLTPSRLKEVALMLREEVNVL